MKIYTYPAISFTQGQDGPPLVLFGASALEISKWSGVPQKKPLGENATETTGFQRELSPARVEQLIEFYAEARNTIQNPLLCASRSHGKGQIEFTASEQVQADLPVTCGELRISYSPLEDKSLLELLAAAKLQLEARVPDLTEREVPETVLADLRELARSTGHEVQDLPVEEEENGDDGEAGTENSESLAAVVEDETHILEFYDEISARILLLQELDEYSDDEFLGYTKEAVIAYLKPVVLVDGQHRLEGAIKSVDILVDDDEKHQREIAELIDDDVDPRVAEMQVKARMARVLPVSLLLTDDPAEHVFQFVIVNQKATPMGKPLLGTIISTTLSNDELESVSTRLENAGIRLEDSRAIASLSRDANSPFYGLVEKGLVGERKDVLAWSVFGKLVRIFKDLNSGKLFGQRNDYADKWRRDYLEKSAIADDYASFGFETAYDYWSSASGPWRQVFISFWSTIRDKFGNTADDAAHNYWGGPRKSNLFNKISLTILAADFFQFLVERGRGIDSAQEVPELVSDWLKDVDPTYFNRNWDLEGVKKDSTGIRNQWARIWNDYRKDPNRLPQTRGYRNAFNPS